MPRSMRAGLMAVYGFARLVDDAGDGDLADPATAGCWASAPPTPPGPLRGRPGTV